MTIEDYKNISALLQTGKFTLTAQESALLVNLVNKIGETIKKMEAEPKEEQHRKPRGRLSCGGNFFR